MVLKRYYLAFLLILNSVSLIMAAENPADQKELKVISEKLKILTQEYRKSTSPEDKVKICEDSATMLKKYYSITKDASDLRRANKRLQYCQKIKNSQPSTKAVSTTTPISTSEVPNVSKMIPTRTPWTLPLSLSYHTWQDRFFLNSSGQSQLLLSAISGISVQMGMEKRYSQWEWGGEVGYFFGKVNFGSTDGSTFQENVSLSGILGGLKVLRPIDDQVAFGIKLPFFMGSGNYGKPTDPSYSYEGDKKSLIGLQLYSNYRMNKWNLGLGIGRWTYDKYLYWTTQFSYDF